MARKAPPVQKIPLTSLPAWIATWFGAGLLPAAPGTWGSLAALPVAWLIHAAGGRIALALAAAALFAAGLWATRHVLRGAASKDPAPVVVDEVVGQWFALLPAALDPLHYGLGFVLFRIADVIKPWPVSWADRRLPGAVGVMADDVAAALYAALVLYLLIHVIGV